MAEPLRYAAQALFLRRRQRRLVQVVNQLNQSVEAFAVYHGVLRISTLIRTSSYPA